MPTHTPLIATIVAGLTIAFILGTLAHRLKISPLVGYLLAGVLCGPFTPGFVADQHLANELAEIGVILLMFGVGLHFSLKDLLSVRAIAIPGALVQIASATVLGAGLGWLLGWPLMAGLVFGLALSVASTVVLLRALQERRILQTDRGRIAVGWLIVEDLAMVLALVILPAVAGAMSGAGSGDIVTDWVMPLGITLLKVAGFVAFMLIVGRRVIPWVLHYVAHTGSRELFRLAVLAIALGVAFGAAYLFDVSFALGAFFAGMILAESELSHRAAEETLPLRDAFAVLFFVSVGMLFDPSILLDPWPLLATLGIILVGKSLAALLILQIFKQRGEVSLTVAASLAQIGEFSFILAGLGVGLGLLPEQGRDLILGGAIISIVLNPLFFVVAEKITAKARRNEPAAPPAFTGHDVVIGYGRVGRMIAAERKAAGSRVVVVEASDEAAIAASEHGFTSLTGNAADARVLAQTAIAGAERLFVAIPDPFEGGQIVEQARRMNPGLEIIARAHSDEAQEHLMAHGATTAVMGEQEIARSMLGIAHVPDPVEDPVAPAPLPDRLPDASVVTIHERLILDDAEWAVLHTLVQLGYGPSEAISQGALQDQTSVTAGFSADRVLEAIAGLISKAALNDLADGRVALTPTGAQTART